LFETKSNYSNYRSEIKNAKDNGLAIVPYLGILFQQLVVLHELPSATDQKTINYTKFRKIAAIIQDVTEMQNTDYDFTVIQSISKFLNNIFTMTPEDLKVNSNKDTRNLLETPRQRNRPSADELIQRYHSEDYARKEGEKNKKIIEKGQNHTTEKNQNHISEKIQNHTTEKNHNHMSEKNQNHTTEKIPKPRTGKIRSTVEEENLSDNTPKERNFSQRKRSQSISE